MTGAEGGHLRPSDRRIVGWFRTLEGAAVWIGSSLIALASAAVWFAGTWPWLRWVAVAVLLVGVVSQAVVGWRYRRLVDRESTAKARAEQRSHAIQTILTAALHTLMEELDNVDFDHARASVYRHKGGHFILLCRESSNLELKRRGRDKYPTTGGLIAKAWQSGRAYVRDLPEDRTEWEARCRDDFGMEPEAAAGINMQSRSLAGVRLATPGAAPRDIGLVVVESLSPRGVTGEAVDILGSSRATELVKQVLVEAVACLDEEDVDSFHEQQLP